MAALENIQMIKGSQLMIFRKVGTAWKSVGFATNHQLSIQTSTSSVQTKDHGNYPAVVPQQTTWTLTAENVYCDTGAATDASNAERIYMKMLNDQEQVDLYFSKATWNAANLGAQGYGIVAGTQGAGATVPTDGSWTRATGAANTVIHGKAYVTDFSVNAPTGDYATLSVTFTGSGAFTTT